MKNALFLSPTDVESHIFKVDFDKTHDLVDKNFGKKGLDENGDLLFEIALGLQISPSILN